MATSNSGTSTKEYQVLKKYFARLTRAIINPSTLAGELFSTNLIADQTRIKATIDKSNHVTDTHCLLNDLMSAVALDWTKFTEIISVLKDHSPTLSTIAKEMERECGKKTIIMYYINITELTFDNNY